MGLIRVMVVDDATLVREGICRLLRDRESVVVVGEASDAREAVDLVGQVHPDVILLDQDTPGGAVPEAVRLLKRQHPPAEILVLADSPNPEQAYWALEAGASGYVLKDIRPDTLIRAIHGVHAQRVAIPPRITRQFVERLRLLMLERDIYRDGLHSFRLTGRDLKIIIAMTRGATDREIARKAGLEEATVKSHIRSILRKIGARNRAQGVGYALYRRPMH